MHLAKGLTNHLTIQERQTQETEHSSETKIIDEHNLIGNYSGDLGVMVLGDEDGYPTVDV